MDCYICSEELKEKEKMIAAAAVSSINVGSSIQYPEDSVIHRRCWYIMMDAFRSNFGHTTHYIVDVTIKNSRYDGYNIIKTVNKEFDDCVFRSKFEEKYGSSLALYQDNFCCGRYLKIGEFGVRFFLVKSIKNFNFDKLKKIFTTIFGEFEMKIFKDENEIEIPYVEETKTDRFSQILDKTSK